MRIGLTGREGRISAAARAALAGLALAATLALGACTTVEGTNALTDAGTMNLRSGVSEKRFTIAP